MNAETRFIPEKVVPATKGYFDEKIAIIGGGPAGLSCAFYLAEKDISRLFSRKMSVPAVCSYTESHHSN